MFDGANEAARSNPSGPPPVKMTASDMTARQRTSSDMNTPRTLAPTSTLNSDSAVTPAQAMRLQTYQGQEMLSLSAISPDATAPKKP